MEYHLRLENLSKSFGSVKAVKNLSLNIKRGELVTLLGPSGCGKTTTMHMIAGFHQPDNGKIFLNDRDITYQSSHKRETPMVFQEYALFPHLTIAENIAYGLKIRKTDKDEMEEKVEEVLGQLGLPDIKERFPNQLSGGQQQRIALARALVLDPEVLLLDEPLSNLDAKLRIKVRYEIKQLQKKFDITMIYVTHDQEEALSISDRIAVMNQGVLQQYGDAWDIYYRPANKFVAEFVGETNFLTVRVADVQDVSGGRLLSLNWEGEEFKIKDATDSSSDGIDSTGSTASSASTGGRASSDSKSSTTSSEADIRPGIGEQRTLLLRPEAVNLSAEKGNESLNTIKGQVLRSSFLGTITRYWIDVKGSELVVDDSKTSEHGLFEGEVYLSFGNNAHLL